MTLLPLAHADDEREYGGKAVSLGAALRAGLPVCASNCMILPFSRSARKTVPAALTASALNLGSASA